MVGQVTSKVGQVTGSKGREWDKAVKIGTGGSLYVLQSNLRQTSRRMIGTVLVRKGGRLEAEGLGWSFYNNL